MVVVWFKARVCFCACSWKYFNKHTKVRETKTQRWCFQPWLKKADFFPLFLRCTSFWCSSTPSWWFKLIKTTRFCVSVDRRLFKLSAHAENLPLQLHANNRDVQLVCSFTSQNMGTKTLHHSLTKWLNTSILYYLHFSIAAFVWAALQLIKVSSNSTRQTAMAALMTLTFLAVIGELLRQIKLRLMRFVVRGDSFRVCHVSAGVCNSQTSDCSYNGLLDHLNLTSSNTLLEIMRPVKNWTSTTIVQMDMLVYSILDVVSVLLIFSAGVDFN